MPATTERVRRLVWFFGIAAASALATALVAYGLKALLRIG
jgi:hypothetical protein